jgi:choline dehydrogenase-like flavoprotein
MRFVPALWIAAVFFGLLSLPASAFLPPRESWLSKRRPSPRKARATPRYQLVYDPVGTVRMGKEPAEPLQPDLRLKGVDGLWVADASVIPSIVPALTNAAVVAVAERAVDCVLDTY